MVNSESVVGAKLGDSDVVIGYQVDESTHTWLVEDFIAQSCIYPSFTGKFSILTHFQLEPGCEDDSLLGAVGDLEHGLVSVLTDSTPELDPSPDEADAIPSSVCSGFLNSASTVSDTSRPLLVS